MPCCSFHFFSKLFFRPPAYALSPTLVRHPKKFRRASRHRAIAYRIDLSPPVACICFSDALRPLICVLLVKDDDKRLISAADNADFFWFRSSLAILQRTTNLWLLWRQIPTLLMIFTTIVINKWIQVQSQHGNTVAIFSATLVSRMPYRAADMLFTDNRARKI